MQWDFKWLLSQSDWYTQYHTITNHRLITMWLLPWSPSCLGTTDFYCSSKGKGGHCNKNCVAYAVSIKISSDKLKMKQMRFSCWSRNHLWLSEQKPNMFAHQLKFILFPQLIATLNNYVCSLPLLGNVD